MLCLLRWIELFADREEERDVRASGVEEAGNAMIKTDDVRASRQRERTWFLATCGVWSKCRSCQEEWKERVGPGRAFETSMLVDSQKLRLRMPLYIKGCFRTFQIRLSRHVLLINLNVISKFIGICAQASRRS